jgi:hypothetical protein
MNTTESVVSPPLNHTAEFQEALDDLTKGICRPEKTRGLRTHGPNPRGESQTFR